MKMLLSVIILAGALGSGCTTLDRGLVGAGEDAGVIKGKQGDVARRIAELLVGKGEANPVKGIAPVDTHFVGGVEFDPATYMFRRRYEIVEYGASAISNRLQAVEQQDQTMQELLEILREAGYGL